jgi:hypothetical protein
MKREFVIAMIVAVTLVTSGSSPAADPAANPKQATLNGAKKTVWDALGEETEMDFIQTPLRDVIESIRIRHGVQVSEDMPALNLVDVTPDTEVTKQLKKVRLDLALDLTLADLQLGFAVEGDEGDQVIIITSRADADRIMALRHFDVHDLLGDGGNSADFVHAVRTVVPKPLPPLPDRTSDTKLPTSRFLESRSLTEEDVAVFRNTLVVRTTAHGHLAVQRLLADLRKDARSGKGDHAADQK